MRVVAKVNSRQVDRELRKLVKRANRKNLLAALVAGALLISNAAKKLAPYLTGTLRRSIHVGGYTNKTGVAGLQSGFKADGEGGQYSDLGEGDSSNGHVSVKIGTNVFYGIFQEFGTRHMSARPFLRPAYNQNVNAALKEVARVLKKLLID